MNNGHFFSLICLASLAGLCAAQGTNSDRYFGAVGSAKGQHSDSVHGGGATGFSYSPPSSPPASAGGGFSAGNPPPFSPPPAAPTASPTPAPTPAPTPRPTAAPTPTPAPGAPGGNSSAGSIPPAPPPMYSPCAAGYFPSGRDIRGGPDLFLGAGVIEVDCAGQNQPPRISAAAGHIFENTYGAIYGPNESCSPPFCEPQFSAVPAAQKIQNLVLNENESQTRLLGKIYLSDIRGSGDPEISAPGGMQNLYVLAGSGCLGQNCSYRFYLAQPRGYFAGTTNTAKMSVQLLQNTNEPYYWTGRGPVGGFIQACPPGQIVGLIGTTDQDSTSITYFPVATGLVNHKFWPQAAACFSSSPAPATVKNGQANSGDAGGAPCPPGQWESASFCWGCRADELGNPSASIDQACHPRAGVTEPGLDAQNLLELRFAR